MDACTCLPSFWPADGWTETFSLLPDFTQNIQLACELRETQNMSERAPSKSSKKFHEKVRNFFFPLFAPPLTSKVASETEKRDASVCKVGLHSGRKWVDSSSKTSMAFKDCRVMARGRRSRRWVYFWIISHGNISKTGKVPRVHRKSEIRKDLSHVICVYFHFLSLVLFRIFLSFKWELRRNRQDLGWISFNSWKKVIS